MPSPTALQFRVFQGLKPRFFAPVRSDATLQVITPTGVDVADQFEVSLHEDPDLGDRHDFASKQTWGELSPDALGDWFVTISQDGHTNVYVFTVHDMPPARIKPSTTPFTGTNTGASS